MHGDSPSHSKDTGPTPRSGAFTEAILFVARAPVRPLLRQQLRSVGIEDIVTAESIEACFEMLHEKREALLILDWDHGAADVNAVLRAARGEWGIDTRPIFLIAAEVSLDILAIGTEYHVARIHTGEITRDAMQEHLEHLIEEESATSGYRAALIEVAAARARGDYAAAGRSLRSLHDRYADNRRITCELADNLIHEDRWQDALALLEGLSVTERYNLRVQHLMARCMMKLGRYDEASAILARGRLVNPHNPDRLIDLGQALLRVGRVQEALSSFDEALALDGTLKSASLGRAECQLVLGEVNEALALLRQISGPRELASIFNSAAILCVRQSKVDQGLNLYKTAIAALGGERPNDGGPVMARLFYNLGLAFERVQRDEEALRCYDRATRFDRHFDKPKRLASRLAARLGRMRRTPGDAADHIYESDQETTAILSDDEQDIDGIDGIDAVDDTDDDDFDEEALRATKLPAA